MPAKHSRHIALTGPLSAWVEEQVARGEYASASDLIRAAVRLLRVQSEGQSTESLRLQKAPMNNRRARA